MQALCAQHFPLVVFRSGSRFLWNPVTRKSVSNQPEERVRLQVLEYLIEEAGISRGRISTERSLGRHGAIGEAGRQRTDILVFPNLIQSGTDRESRNPETLIECKARSVSLSDSTAMQIARYNQALGTPQLWLCNGHHDFWFQVSGASLPDSPLNSSQMVSVEPISSPFYPSVKSISEIRRQEEYWGQRGFIAPESPTAFRSWLENVQRLFWEEVEELKTSYLDLSRNPWQGDLSHYYRIAHLDEESDLAIGFVATDEHTTWLVALMNKHQSNAGMIVTHLEALAEGKADNTTIYTVNDKKTANLTDHIPLQPFKIHPMILSNLPGFFESWFRQILTV